MSNSANVNAEARLLTLLDLAETGARRASVGADLEDSDLQGAAGDVSPTVAADVDPAIGADLEDGITIGAGSIAADTLGSATGADLEDGIEPGAAVAADLVNTVDDRGPSLGADLAPDGPAAAADMGTTGGPSAAADLEPIGL